MPLIPHKQDMSDHDLLISISAVVEDMSHRLLGNGQPGEIADLKKRTGDLEKFQNTLNGAMKFLIFIITVLASATIYQFIK